MKKLLLILVLFAGLGAYAAETIAPNTSTVISCSACPTCETNPPTQGATKLVCMGDSVTAGIRTAGDLGPAVTETDTFCYKIAQNEGYTSYVNKGVGGNTSAQMLARFQADVLNQNPNRVTIMAWINDAHQNVPVATYKANILSMVQQAKAANIKATLFTPNLVRQSVFINKYGNYRAALREISTQEQVPLLDVYGVFTDWAYANGGNASDNTYYQTMMNDAQHPAPNGHTEIANLCKRNKNACSP